MTFQEPEEDAIRLRRPIVEPLGDHFTRALTSSGSGAAYIDVPEGERLRVAGFTRSLDQEQPYRGRHRK